LLNNILKPDPPEIDTTEVDSSIAKPIKKSSLHATAFFIKEFYNLLIKVTVASIIALKLVFQGIRQ